MGHSSIFFFKYDSLLDAHFLSLREIGPHIAVIGCPYKVALLEILGTTPESLERLAKMYWALKTVVVGHKSPVHWVLDCFLRQTSIVGDETWAGSVGKDSSLDVAFVLIDCFAKTGHCYPV